MMEGEVLRLTIALISGRSIEVDAPREWTLRELQEALQVQSGIPVPEQQLLAGDACLTSGLLAEQPLSTILGERKQFTLARKDRSLSLGAGVFCGFGDQPQMVIDGNEIALNWCESCSCFYGEEDVRPDDRTSASAVFIALEIPSIFGFQYDAYIDCSVFTQPGFVPLPVQGVQLHVGPTFFPDIIQQGKHKKQYPFMDVFGHISLEVWLWCKTWEMKLPQDEMVNMRVKTLTGKTICFSMPRFSPMMVAEMIYHDSQGFPLGGFFLFHPKANSSVCPTKVASELQQIENEPVLDCLLASECLGPYRKKGAGDKAASKLNLCLQLEYSPPLHREALEDLKGILFEGAQQVRIISGQSIGDLTVGAAVKFAEFRAALAARSKCGVNNLTAWESWKLLELEV